MYFCLMDAQTLNLLITAGAAIIAGLGGASLTAAINRRNTKDTLALAKASNAEQLTHAKEIERITWLRDRKHEVYVDYLIFAGSLMHSSDERRANISTDLAPLRARLDALATSEVRRIAREIDRTIETFLNARAALSREAKTFREALNSAEPTKIIESPEMVMKEYKGDFGVSVNKAKEYLDDQEKALHELMRGLVTAVRKDLGTATADDDDLEQWLLSVGRTNLSFRP